jgi:drug/metabolite transporter (DMT)-like permease
MNSIHIGELAAMGTALLWTLSALAWTSSGKYMGALPVSFIRLLVTCVYLSIFGLFHLPALPLNVDAETWLLLISSGFFGFFIADICLFKAFLLIGPRISLLLQTLSPPLAQIMARIFIGDRLAVKDWIGMAVTLGGVVWVLLERPETTEDHQRHLHAGRGILLGLISAFAGAVGALLAKIGIGNYDASAVTYIRVLGGLIGYVGLATILRRWPQILQAARHGRGMSILMFGSFVGPFLGVILFMISLRHCHVGVVTTIISTMPVLILPFLIVFYHERVSLRAWAGAVVAVLGVAVLVW